MSNLPFHRPAEWELFRNESVTSKRQREALQESKARADAMRRGGDGLAWSEQRWVDQVVPAEMVNPDDFDTFNYRYQLYARPPPVLCKPRDLSDVADEAPPIHYNVRRVAVDKPCTAEPSPCSAHWVPRPWTLQETAEIPHRETNDRRVGRKADCSGNNNSQAPPAYNLINTAGSHCNNVSEAASVTQQSSCTSFTPSSTDNNNNCSKSKNNNAPTTDRKPAQYPLHCCPIQECGKTLGVGDKMLCQPNNSFPGNKPTTTNITAVCSRNKRNANEPYDEEKHGVLHCREMPICPGSGRTPHNAGPVLVCQPPPKDAKPKPGYGTYKIIGSKQYREAPEPLIENETKLPPHLEEYKEFTRRCPNYTIGRYDRSDPANELMLPSHKDAVLIRGSRSPFLFCRNPKAGKLPPLFKHVQTPPLDWSIPSFIMDELQQPQKK